MEEQKKRSITICSDFANDKMGFETLIKSIDYNAKIDHVNIITNKNNSDYIKYIKKFINLNIKTYFIEEYQDFYEILEFRKSKNILQLSHIPISCYYRFLIPKLINSLETTLYMDTDTFIRKEINLEKLIFVKENGFSVSVVKNVFKNSSFWFKSYEGIYKNRFETKKKAFNSGIMLFNFNTDVASNELYEKLIESLGSNDFKYLDQAHFNFVLKDNVNYLDLTYNFPHHSGNLNLEKYWKKDNVSIVHFGSKRKPWNSKSSKKSSFSKEWHEYQKFYWK